jgi:23S rRNA pseudouridine2605 synthase
VNAAARGVEPLRLNRFLAARGLASRRGADLLIATGRVTVNGRRGVPGAKVDPLHDTVKVDGLAVPGPVVQRTLMLNKPPGMVSTRRDPQGRPTVFDLVDDAGGLFCVGRLDSPSRGLLLLTSDGELSLRLTHPRYQVEKTYRVAIRGHAPAKALRAMVAGLTLEDGPARARRVRLAGATATGDIIEMVMTEGRRREIRRICAALGLTVVDLERVAIGGLRLGRLHAGQARPLTVAEVTQLYASARLEPPR